MTDIVNPEEEQTEPVEDERTKYAFKLIIKITFLYKIMLLNRDLYVLIVKFWTGHLLKVNMS